MKPTTPMRAPMRGVRARVMRLSGLIHKEFLQILRDPSSIGIAIVLPIVLLLVFGYGVSLNAKGVRLAFVADVPSHETQSLYASFARSEYFSPTIVEHLADAKDMMQHRKIDAIVYLQSDFVDHLTTRTKSAPIELIVNGVDANTARQVIGYVNGVWSIWLSKQAQVNGLYAPMPAVARTRVWYNAQIRSRNYLVPGLIAVIMTLIGALLTSMVITREWERGTMESLLSTPITISEILLSKFVPYYILGILGMVLSLAMAVWLFGVPLRGPLWVMLGTASLFMFAAVGLGLLISTVAKSQFVAGQIAIVVTFLPAFILSGFIFDIRSMPMPIQYLTHIIPARYFVSILQTVFLAGFVPAVIVPNAVALAVMGFIFLGIVAKKTSRLIG